MTPDILIRSVQPSDAPLLGAFLAENNLSEVTRQFNAFPLTMSTAQRICLKGLPDLYFIALAGQRIVGLTMLRGWSEGYDVPSFGILVDYRSTGAGLGRRLMEFAIAEARRIGCNRMRLSVYLSNTRALLLYTAVGFVEVQREPVTVAGESDVKIVMIKDLHL